MFTILIILVTIFFLSGIAQSDIMTVSREPRQFDIDKDGWKDDGLYLDDNERY